MPEPTTPTAPAKQDPISAAMADLQQTLKATPPASTPPPVPEPAAPTTAPVTAPAADGTVAPAPPAEPPSFEFKHKPKSEDWKFVNSERARLAKELEEANGKLSKIGDPEHILKLSEEAEGLRKTLREVAADRDPELQAQYQSRRASLVADAKEAVGSELADEIGRVLERYGAQAGPKIRELAKEHQLDQFSATQLAAAVSGLKSLEAEREGLVKRSAENWSRHVTEQTLAQERQVKQAMAARESALADLLKQHADNPLLKDGAEEVGAVAKRVLVGDMDTDEVARAALMVGAYPRLVKHTQSQAGKIAELEALVAKLRGDAPGGGSGATAPSGGPSPLPSGFKPGVITPGVSAGSLAMQEMRRAGVS
jgi:hypothetical protein